MKIAKDYAKEIVKNSTNIDTVITLLKQYATECIERYEKDKISDIHLYQ